jgi:hypothetical protein
MSKKILRFAILGMGVLLLANAAPAAEKLLFTDIFDHALAQINQLSRDIDASFDLSLDTLRAQGNLHAKINDLSFDISPLGENSLELTASADLDLAAACNFSTTPPLPFSFHTGGSIVFKSTLQPHLDAKQGVNLNADNFRHRWLRIPEVQVGVTRFRVPLDSVLDVVFEKRLYEKLREIVHEVEGKLNKQFFGEQLLGG